MEELNKKIEGDIKLKSPLLEKLDNFWYHYKWHTIVSLVAAVIIIILTVQACSKVETDLYVLYAGPHTVSRTSSAGNLSEYETASSSFKKIGADYTSDGIVTIAFTDLFVINSEEADQLLADNPGKEINSALVKENTDTLHQKLLYGEYYLCFLSERIFREYDSKYGSAIFTELSPYEKDGAEYEYASERGIYLRSLPFSSLPEICNFPADTVVCLRAISDVSNVFDKRTNEKHFVRGEDMMRKLLSYGIK